MKLSHEQKDRLTAWIICIGIAVACTAGMVFINWMNVRP